MILKFEKERDRWYVDLPEWTGSKDDLEMVLGADTMLDILAQGESRAWIMVELKLFIGYLMHLEFDREEDGGAWYNLRSKHHAFPVWLCHVTKFVFNEFPKNLYIA